MFKIEGTKSQGCCYCDKYKLVNKIQNKNAGLFEKAISYIYINNPNKDNQSIIHIFIYILIVLTNLYLSQ